MKRSAPSTQIFRKTRLVILRSPRQQCRYERYSHAATDVPGEIHQTGGGIVLPWSEVRVGRSIDRNKQKSESGSLEAPGNDESGESDLQVKSCHAEQRERQCGQSRGNQKA